jgi:carbonic anhydrase
MKILVVILLFLASFEMLQGQPNENSAQNTDIALETLMKGNDRFLSGSPVHPHETSNWRSQLKEGQKPFAVVIGCSDSRVPPELVFDQGFGDIFVIRIAGNVIDTDVLASVEYAIEHLETKLIVVLGHTGCGAVKATIDHLNNPGGEPAEIVSLLYQIEPAVIGIPAEKLSEDSFQMVVKRNIELGVRKLSRAPAIRSKLNSNEISIKGAVYDIMTGQVKMLK